MRRKLILLALLMATSAQAAPTTTSQTVSGLQAPAEIRIDTWGIPHIYAASVRDAFFLQGYNAARDRLWQIDLWRKRGLGRLAQDFGPAYAAQDRAARLFLYRGDMDAEWAAYGPGAKANSEAWVAGVNAYVAEISAGKRGLPQEFKLAGSQPGTWSADDVVRIRSHGLTRNVGLEVSRAQIACVAGLPATRLLKLLEPAWTTKVPEGLDPCDIPAGVLADYDLATSGVRFSPKTAGLAALDVPHAELVRAAGGRGGRGAARAVHRGKSRWGACVLIRAAPRMPSKLAQRSRRWRMWRPRAARQSSLCVLREPSPARNNPGRQDGAHPGPTGAEDAGGRGPRGPAQCWEIDAAPSRVQRPSSRGAVPVHNPQPVLGHDRFP